MICLFDLVQSAICISSSTTSCLDNDRLLLVATLYLITSIWTYKHKLIMPWALDGTQLTNRFKVIETHLHGKLGWKWMGLKHQNLKCAKWKNTELNCCPIYFQFKIQYLWKVVVGISYLCIKVICACETEEWTHKAKLRSQALLRLNVLIINITSCMGQP